MTTLDLFTTTVDAVGMNGTVTGGLYYLLLLVGTPTLLITLSDVAWTNHDRKVGRKFTTPWKRWALAELVLAVCFGPFFLQDFSSYSENAIRRIAVRPKPAEETNPSPEDKTIVSAVHDDFQKAVDKDALKELGLDSECRSQRDITSSPKSLSVLCGGYSLEPVVTDNATLTPRVKTSADLVGWPWSIDPHTVEVTGSIEISKK